MDEKIASLKVSVRMAASTMGVATTRKEKAAEAGTSSAALMRELEEALAEAEAGWMRRSHELSEAEELREHLAAAAKEQIISGARALLCTVAMASRSLLWAEELAPAVSRISTAILDEAGTCPEPKLPLLALLPSLKRVIAIGDHKQLQPFTLWRPAPQAPGGGFFRGGSAGRGGRGRGRGGFSAGSLGFGRSSLLFGGGGSGGGRGGVEPTGFFFRLQQALEQAVQSVPSLLDQYRMHPEVADAVSACFYSGELRTPAEVAAARLAACRDGLFWLRYNAPASGGAEFKPPRSTSFENQREAEAVVEAVRACRAGAAGRAKGIMIITFYKGQERLLRRTLADSGFPETEINEAAHGSAAAGAFLRVMSVDQAQGSEADVVVLSCVRSNAGGSIGFVSNANRVNVAVSRAKERLVIIGDVDTLGRDANWRRLHARALEVEGAWELPQMQQQVRAAAGHGARPGPGTYITHAGSSSFDVGTPSYAAPPAPAPATAGCCTMASAAPASLTIFLLSVCPCLSLPLLLCLFSTA